MHHDCCPWTTGPAATNLNSADVSAYNFPPCRTTTIDPRGLPGKCPVFHRPWDRTRPRALRPMNSPSVP
jgi:hypothetical protein